MDSVFRVYDDINCKLIAEEHYLSGEKHGSFIKFGFKGDTLSLETYKMGKRDGRYAVWKDRDLETYGYYQDGEPHGYWKYGFSSYYQMREGEYDHGVTIGLWKFYDQKGNLLAKQWYNDEGEEIKSKFYKKKVK